MPMHKKTSSMIIRGNNKDIEYIFSDSKDRVLALDKITDIVKKN